MIAPRHPERFEEVSAVVAAAGFACVRRTSSEGGESARTADVLLLDTIGELAAAYADASLVFVGGSLVPRGGHNILEPALYARPIVVGPHTQNFRQVVGDFLEARAVVQLPEDRCDADGVASAFADLLLNADESVRMGERALAVLESNRGATQRTFEAVRRMLEQKQGRS